MGVQATYSAMQAGAQVAQMPMIAPVADEIMKGAGYIRPHGEDPTFPGADKTAAMNIKSPYIQGAEVPQNTSPAFPPVPQEGASPMEGIETPTPADNLG